MVFRQVKRPKLALKKCPAVANLDNLSDDVLYLILDDLSTKDLLSARSACSNLTPICNSLVAKRNTLLYIHPTKTSLRNAVKVCQFPVWSVGITEVVLLGYTMWADIYRYFIHRPRGYNPQKDPCFRHWPRCGLDDRNTAAAGEPPCRVFSKAYADIIDALARLPNLKKLSFADNVQRPGFNQVSSTQLKTYSRKCAMLESTNDGRPLSDLEAFFGFLFSRRLRFEEIALEPMMLFALDMERLWSLSHWLHGTLVFQRLKKIELTIDYHHKLTLVANHFRNLLYHSSSLQDLKIFIHHLERQRLSWSDWLYYPSMLHHVLNGRKFTELEKLTITQRPARDYAGEDPTPTMVQAFDMVSFLESHRSTLRHVHLDNVTFTDRACSTATHEVTKLVLDKMISLRPQLEHVVWRIARSEHELGCCKIKDSVRHCSNSCGRYHYYDPDGTTQVLPSTVNDFKQLAHSNWVYEDLRTKHWDFGTAVLCADAIHQRTDAMG